MQEGSRIQGYLILGEAGRGGMGVVYHARDESLERDVAIKVLPEQVAFNPERMARFQREAKLLASLEHANIASIYELVEKDGQAFVVMQYVQGESLSDRTARGPMPLDEVVPIAMEIASAMAYAHGRGVIHRDLKPANVKLDAEGRAKVLDFGLAKAISDDGTEPSAGGSSAPPSSSSAPAPPSDPPPASVPPSSAVDDDATIVDQSRSSRRLAGTPMPSTMVTSAGSMMGTLGYASPEQIRGRAVDRRTDIFAFGALLFEMLAGGPPFPADTAADVVGKTLHKEPEWESLPAGLPPRLVLLLRRCLSKDLGDRLCDMGDARLELAQLRDHGDLFEDDASARSGGSTVWKVLAVVCLLVAVGLGALLATGPASVVEEAVVVEAEPVRHVALPVDLDLMPGFLTVTDDGRRVFAVLERFVQNEFAWGGMENFERSLSVRDIGSNDFRPLAKLNASSGFAISPDGAAFVLNEGGTLSRGLVDVDSEPVVLGKVPGAILTGTNTVHSQAVRGVVWFDADRIVVLVVDDDGKPGIAIVDPGSGKVLRSVPIQGLPDDMRFSGLLSRFDEDQVLVSVNTGEPADRVFGLATVALSDGAARVLVMDAGDAEIAGDRVYFTRHDTIHGADFDRTTGSLSDAGDPVLGGVRSHFVAHGEIELTDAGTLLHLPGGLQRNERRIFNGSAEGDGLGSYDDGPYPGPIAVSWDGGMICVGRQRENGRSELWGGRTTRGQLSLVVPARDGVVQYYFLSDDGSKLVLGRTVGGDTVIEVGSFRANASMEPIWRFSEDGAFFPQSFHPEGDRLLGHRPAPTETGEMALGLFELDLSTRELTPVHTPGEGAVLGQWSPKSDILLFQRVLDSFGMTQPRGFLFNPGTGETVPIGELPMYERQWIVDEDGGQGLVYWERADSPRYIPIDLDEEGGFVIGREIPWDLELPPGAVVLKIDGRGDSHAVVRGANESPAGHVDMIEHWITQFDRTTD